METSTDALGRDSSDGSTDHRPVDSADAQHLIPLAKPSAIVKSGDTAVSSATS